MKKIFLILSFLFLLNTPTFSLELQGGVKFNVDSARDYVQSAQINNIPIPASALFVENQETQKIVYSYNNSGEVIGITVQNKTDPTKARIYDRDRRLIYVETYDKPVSVYPHRGYRYNMDGKLVLTSLTVSKDEMFRFTPDGKLVAHSINGVIYDEDGNIIGTGKANKD